LAIKKYIERLRRIDYLVRTKAGGNLKSLSKKLDLSRSTTIDFLKEMKEMGFPISYCKKRKCYYYNEEGKMVDKLFNKDLNKEEMKKITGGKNFYKFFLQSENTGL
jgi:Mn-dependent DtxR family transcriptional regulator